jgi:hypothetical protein
MAMLRAMCFCAVEDGLYGCLDLRREGSRWYSCRHPHRCRGMDVVMFVPSAGVGAVVGGPMAPHLSRGLHMSLRRGGSTPRGSSILMMSWGLG